jgi:predicted ATPase
MGLEPVRRQPKGEWLFLGPYGVASGSFEANVAAQDRHQRSADVKIEAISIENFKAIRQGLVDFDPELTILLGRNGSGKTSVLDAVSRCLKAALALWSAEHGTASFHEGAIQPHELRYGAKSAGVELRLRFDELVTDLRKQNVNLSYDASSKQSSNRIPPISPPGAPAALNRTLPVYYRQDRSFHSAAGMDEAGRNQVWHLSIDGNFRILNDLNRWWDKRDAQEARQVRDHDPDYRDPQLEAIRQAVGRIEGFQRIFFSSDLEPPGLVLEKSNGMRVPIGQLSSGELSYITLIADLARRLQMIEPDKPLGEIEGVVLIDEIELNLHPAWQSQITPMLRTIFRSCQFVISTHSPQVVSGVESRHVRILEMDDNGTLHAEAPKNTKGRTSDFLLEGVFKASERDPVIDNLIYEFNDAVDNADHSRAAELLAEIQAGIDGDPPEIAVLRKRLRRIEGAQ